MIGGRRASGAGRAGRRSRWALVALLLATAAPVRAVQPDEILADPVLEQRARAISGELRCLVCQNQSIDDSDAPLARDLRLLVRERLRAGSSDGDVRDFLVRRYGEFVLLRPSFNWRTALLWLGPAALIVVGAGYMVMARRRRRGEAGQAVPLTAAERARLSALLKG